MIFTTTNVEGVLVVDVDPQTDERGSFARTYCRDEFATHGADWTVAQCSVSFNHQRGTLRGLHLQADPFPDAKLVRCSKGRVFDVAVDLRPSSPTYCEWVGAELCADRANALVLPPGCAHGFLTLDDATEVSYSIDTPYVPALARGVRWDDPAFAIRWPFRPEVISERDANYGDYRRGCAP